jgi:hypothetical protein
MSKSKYWISVLCVLLFPPITLAGFNDTTLTTNTILSIGSYTLNISGSSAVIQSITVNSSGFSVTLGSGSSITISSPTLNTLTPSSQTGVSSSICNSSTSSITLSYSGVGTITNTITPSATLCVDTTPPPSSGGTSSGGSGYTPPLLPTTPIKPILSNCPIGYVCTKITPSTSLGTFGRNLTLNSIGTDVKALQKYLNSKGFIISTTGLGSPGHETTTFGPKTKQALIKYQIANKITPAVGYFGPITRAFISKNK